MAGRWILAVLGILLIDDVRTIDYSHRKPDAIIYIDNASNPPSPNIHGRMCKKFADPNKFGGEVCGKDGQTYPNFNYLKCYNRRQPPEYRIQLKHRGPCKEYSSECEVDMLYRPVCGSDNQTYANMAALRCKNAMNPDSDVRVVREGECTGQECPCKADLDKVCGSNGVTYRNIGELKCLKRYQPDLQVVHAGACNIREVRKAMSKRIACHMSKTVFDWSPVCGQNNLTYANPYVYICHRPRGERKCGATIGECGSLRQLACLHVEQINKKQLESTSLVCGSNGVTYRSYEHLHCATNYEKHLTAVSTGKCNKKYDPCASIQTPLVDGGQPVCGSDNETYVSVQSLWCTKFRSKKDLKYRHDGNCL